MIRATSQAAPGLRDYRPAEARLVADLLRGLAERPKRLSPMYLYDSRGSRLFERICEQPEYYLTRTETEIMRQCAGDLARSIGPRALLVEFGSGASLKTRLLLDRLPDLAAYVPVDISRSHLLEAARSICEAYPRLEVLPVCADFTRPFGLPRPSRPPARTVVFFPGSTLGNFDEAPAIELLELMRLIARPDGALVIGIDLVKDPAVLQRAYDDAAGVTAEFNLNVLLRLNREFGADFDPRGFRHAAVWVPEASRIEMHLESVRRQSVRLAGEAIEFAAGEPLVTEHCHKYTPAAFAALAARARWKASRSWCDDLGRFSVRYLEA